MSTALKVWQISGEHPEELARTKPREDKLEDWIVNNSDILGEPLLIIGQQKKVPSAGRFDLLGIDVDGRLIIIELKRTVRLGTQLRRHLTTHRG